jgi:hypothetical protein
MANSKTHEMVRGLGMGMTALDILIKEIEKQGGEAEMLQFLTRPRFADNLAQIAKAVVSCDWRIPASEMRDRVEKIYRREFESDESDIETVRNLEWYRALQELGIPYLDYQNDEAAEVLPIPSWIREALDGKTIEFPLFYEEYVVVDLAFGGAETRPKKGAVIRATELTHKYSYLCLAERRYFNFDT